MTEPKQPKFYNLVGHGGEVVPDMLCCEGCGYGVCSCPPDPPDDEPYGCVNRTTDSPRECVESGHYWCDAFKSKPQPAEPTLRAGWTYGRYTKGVLDHANGYRVVKLRDLQWTVEDDVGEDVLVDGRLEKHPTLEAAMIRAEELARGEP